MTLLCRLFGHRPPPRNRWGYSHITPTFDAFDAMGTWHYRIVVRCPRCGSTYTVCQFSTREEVK